MVGALWLEAGKLSGLRNGHESDARQAWAAALILTRQGSSPLQTPVSSPLKWVPVMVPLWGHLTPSPMPRPQEALGKLGDEECG